MLAEDDRLVQRPIRDVLEAFGIGTQGMETDGETAYVLMRHYAADIGITDWVMSPMNMLEILRKVRLDLEAPNPSYR